MYNELFVAWKIETETSELGHLPSDFYARLVAYLKTLNEANIASAEKSVKVTLLAHEAVNAKHMVEELISVRYRKIVRQIVAGQKVPAENLAIEEASLSSYLSPSADDYNKFIAALLSGQIAVLSEVPAAVKVESAKVEEPKVEAIPPPAKAAPVAQAEPAAASTPSSRHVAVRFLKPIPSIIGADMNSYGPFLVEDVASVPELNAKILVKQGLAKLVELA
jgi:DNA replication initiation complex subunit (GINS family)